MFTSNENDTNIIVILYEGRPTLHTPPNSRCISPKIPATVRTRGQTCLEHVARGQLAAGLHRLAQCERLRRPEALAAQVDLGQLVRPQRLQSSPGQRATTEVASALADSVLSGWPSGAEVVEIVCHRYHVERRAEDWGATQEEVRRHCSAVRNKKQTLRYRYHYTRTVHTLA